MRGQDPIRYTNSMPWKEAASKAKSKKSVKLALLVLGLIAGLLVISWAVRFSGILFNSKRNYLWNSEFNINLVLRSSHISLLSYNPKQAKAVIINIPDDTYLEVPRGYGFWQLRSVYGLGGDKLLTDTASSFLGVPVDGYLNMEPEDLIKKNLFSGLNLLSSPKTDLTLWELIKLKLGLSGVRFDKIKEVNLDKLNVLDKDNLPDGTAVYRADPVKLDSVLLDLADPVIVSEHKTIAIFNATNRPQMAKEAARLITNLGGNVIITGNSPGKLDKTAVFGEQSATLKRLRQIFNLSDKIDSSKEDREFSRAQINLLLGEDYLK